MKMSKILHIILVIYSGFYVLTGAAEQCTTLSCIHAAATMIEQMEFSIDPCEDFYEYACGNFDLEIRSADEETTINTFAEVENNMVEYLLTLFEDDNKIYTKKLHQLSIHMFKTCVKDDNVKNRKNEPLLELFKEMNGFPMLDGPNWNETNWNWKTSLLNLRQHISNKTDDVFNTKKNKNEPAQQEIKQPFTDDELIKIKKYLKPWMLDVVKELGVTNETHLEKDIDDLIKFEEKLVEFFNKNKVNKKPKGFHRTIVPGFLEYHNKILWMELLSPSYLSNSSKINETWDGGFVQRYYDFIQQTPNRTIANYVGWRIIQISTDFMHVEMRTASLKFQKSTFGKQDLDQRWKLCAILTQNTASVSTGSLYVDNYFTKGDKISAVTLVDNLLKEYVSTIKNSNWTNDGTKNFIKQRAMDMKMYIGYDDTLITTVADGYYNDLKEYDDDKFFEMGLAFKLFETDLEFRRINGNGVADWTKYSKPATINAFYNAKDNSIQFPAAILQSPNFDKNRPIVMNFGAIGSIIGHEMTHGFDNYASQNEFSPDGEEFQRNSQCIEDQYNNYYFAEPKIYNNSVNGTLTLKENIADCGGIKLAYNAYKKFTQQNGSQSLPIGLNNMTNEQIFWISFAQTHCSIENIPLLRRQKVKHIYAPDRFRVVGALSNMEEFSKDFDCKVGSKMIHEQRCNVFEIKKSTKS